MKGIILAAGYATRLYPLTKDKAKPLLPVHGRPIIDFIVDEMLTLDNLDQIIVVSNSCFASQFEDWARQRKAEESNKVDIVVLDDGTTSEATRLGAIGDIQFCIEQMGIDDDLLVIAGDNLFTYSLRDAWQHFVDKKQDMVLATRLPVTDDLKRYAIAELDNDGLIRSLEEKPEHPKSDIAVFATYFYKRETVPLIAQYLKEGNKPDAPGYFPAWLFTKKPVRGFLFSGTCIDIGTPEAYEEVSKAFPSPRVKNT